MRFIPCREVEAPVLTENEILELTNGSTIEKKLQLKEGDTFKIGDVKVLVKFSMNGKCKLRRMSEEEQRYSAENGGM